MHTGKNKMQTSQAGSVCPACKGTKQVKDANGKVQTCYSCRGTGRSPGYTTK